MIKNPQLSIITPHRITSANITATNVVNQPAWDVGTAYTTGDLVSHDETAWKAVSPSTGVTPSEEAAEWATQGPSNVMAAFDTNDGATDKFRIVDTVTTNADSIEYTIDGLSRITGMAFFGVKAESIRVVATSATEGVMLDQTYILEDLRQLNGSWYNWCFLPLNKEQDYILRDISILPLCTIEITIEAEGYDVEVSSIVLGSERIIGVVSSDIQRGSESYSVRQNDGLFATNLQRTPSPVVSFQLMLYDNEGRQFWQIMNDLGGAAAVWSVVGDDWREYRIFGYHENPQTVGKANGISAVSLEVRGL